MTTHIVRACPRCQAPVAIGDWFCEACGQPIAPANTASASEHAEIDLRIAAGVTDRGLHHRRNEDAFYVACATGEVAMAVSDGVSTSAMPHLAARAAVDAAGQALDKALQQRADAPDTPWDPAVATNGAFTVAQAAVMQVPRRQEVGLNAPACTLTCAIWDGQTVTLGWVGDSRAYWVGSSIAEQLTADHSWAQEQADLHGGGPAYAGDPRAHAITRWLGADAPGQPPEIASFRPNEPGRLIICCDGLWNYAPTPAAFTALVHRSPLEASPLELARALVGYALTAGGQDNVTVVVASLIGEAEIVPEEPRS
jgi:serine/threonine protein phosphatase PrpC